MSSLREKRRIKNAQSIHRVAINLAAEHGLDNVTTEMISEAAGISLRTFFNYFPYKEAAFIPPEMNFTQESINSFVTSKGDLLEDLAKLITPPFHEIEIDQQHLKRSHDVVKQNPKLMVMRVHFVHEFESKIFNAIVNRFKDEEQQKARHIAAVISATIRLSFETWIDENENTLANTIGDNILSLKTLFNK
ncbi:MAG: hypothetical protein COB24_02165 [Hyphomicrobiales bacterium]|nr:MAG: hypothetical protein COB24_02165 [Hyphomicrobiales bacterium]